MQIKCLPEAERPREKGANQGVGTLSDTELLALILHSGTRNLSALGLAENLLGSLENGLCGLGSAPRRRSGFWRVRNWGSESAAGDRRRECP